MSGYVPVFALMLLTLAACQVGPAGREKEKHAESAPEESVATEGSTTKSALQAKVNQPAESPREDSVIAYDSKTNGALQVKVDQKDPVDSFDVLQDGKRVLKGNPRLLNGTVELTPGDYVIDVNRTQRKATIEAGKKTILWTGELVVEGKPSTMAWYAMNVKVKLTSTGVEPLLNKASPLFPGTYTVFVDTSLTGQDKSLGEAQVKAGRKTVLKH